MADTEICDYFKVAPDIYLFTWRKSHADLRYNPDQFQRYEVKWEDFWTRPDMTSGKIVDFTVSARVELTDKITYS